MERGFINDLEKNILLTAKQSTEGILQEIVTYHLTNSGKMLRPKMIQNLGSIYDANLDPLLEWATCLELFHNASLIHDDLQDKDLVRRGKPSVWTKYGEKQAINAGDLLLMISHKPLERINSSDTRNNLSNLFTETAAKIVQGQSLEFQLNELDGSLDTRETYFRCISLKTAALFSCLAKGVGIIAQIPPSELNELNILFEKLGTIFQIQDDILDLYGNKERDESGCDLKEGKVSFLVVKHFEHHPGGSDDLISLLKTKRDLTTNEDVKAMSEKFIELGTLQSCIDELGEMITELKSSPILNKRPMLSNLVDKLVWKILEPIGHLDHSLREEMRA